MNRRDLLRRGFVFAAASTLPAVVPFSLGAQTHRANHSSIPQPVFKPSLLDLHTFEMLKGQTFQVYRDGSSMDPYLTLVEVTPLSVTSGRRTQAFNLRLYGGPSDMLPQGVYRVHNAHLGYVQMFIVPEAKGSRDYFVTYNRLYR